MGNRLMTMRVCVVLFAIITSAVGCARQTPSPKSQVKSNLQTQVSPNPTGASSQVSETKPLGPPKPIDPLTKISRAELERIEKYALKYYEHRVHETALQPRNFLNGNIMKPYLLPNRMGGPYPRFWRMIVVEDHFSVEKVQLYLNQDFAYGSNNSIISGDLYDVTIQDKQVGNVIKGVFYANPQPRIELISVVKLDGQYKVDFDRDFAFDVLREAKGYSKAYYSQLVVFQKDLPQFLENIKPWYKDIPEGELYIPPELKGKVGN